MSYDVVIVGAGIAGLRTGIWLLEHGIRCVILEKYNYIGGRVVTYHKRIPGVGKVQWENGAGRISTRHTKVLGLLKHYGLHTYPISGETGYMSEPGVLQPNRFSALCSIFIDPLRQLPADVLQTHTLRQVSEMVFGSEKTREFYSQFPYFSEVHTSRADCALSAFSKEMGSMDGFVGCAEGLSALIDGMVAEFKKLGGVIELNQEVVSVLSPVVRCKNGTFFAPVCVMALHSEAMKQIRGVSHLPVLQRLVMNPLLRMYAVFPVKKGKAW
jgi:phytoene dehydrogenase-like protein